MTILVMEDGSTVEVETRLLFVCSANRLRSPTAEMVARRHGLVADSVGTMQDLAIVALREDHLRWATHVICMESEHAEIVREFQARIGLPADNPGLSVWHIPDDFDFMDERLQRMIENRLELGGHLRHSL